METGTFFPCFRWRCSLLLNTASAQAGVVNCKSEKVIYEFIRRIYEKGFPIMASGKTHSKVSTITGIVICSSAILQPSQWVNILAIGASCSLLGQFISPDWDVDNGYIGHTHAKKFGYIFYTFYRKLIRPYQLCFKHRSFFSHFPVISSVIRIVYLAFPPVILLFMDDDWKYYIAPALLRSSIMSIPIALFLYNFVPEDMLILMSIGIIISDTMHWIFDSI